ncbi:MAG: hypothetical protein NXI32_12750 [bacterium]|nr:hypothetical protein [bacterium]
MAKTTSKQADSHSRDSSTSAVATGRSWLRWLGALVIVSIALWMARPVLSGSLISAARSAWLRGDFYQAQLWTQRAESFGGASDEALLMQASIARSRGNWSHWQALMEAAESAGAAEAALTRERKLYQLAAGRVEDLQAIESMLGDANVSLAEIFDAVLPGILAAERFELAGQLLSQWAQQFPRDPNQRYWSAMLAEQLSLMGRNDSGSKQEYVDLLNETLEASPYHQRARLALAKLDEEEDRLEEAYQQYAQLWLRDQLAEAQVATARLLRRMGRYGQAREVLSGLDDESAKRERGLLAFEEGQLEQAIELFDATASSSEEEAWATALHLAGRDEQAQALFDKVANRREHQHGQEEQNNRVLSDPLTP